MRKNKYILNEKCCARASWVVVAVERQGGCWLEGGEGLVVSY